MADADPDANSAVVTPAVPPTDMPVHVRLFARLTRQGHLSEPILVKEILLMIVPAAKTGG